MPDTPKHSVSVAGIVVDDQDRVLLIQRRDNGHWEPPGGVLELDETFEEGVKREVFEETGVQIEVQRLSGVYKNLRHGIVALVFRCTPISDRARESVESACVAWVDLSDVTELMEEAYAIRVTDALTSKCFTRSHNGHTLQ